MPVEEIGCFGFSKNSRRWGVASVTPWAERRLPADFWGFGEGRWMVGLGSRGLQWIFAGLVDFGQKMGEVFVVGGLTCGEDEGQSLGGLRRWSSGGFLGEVWDEMAVRGVGNSGGCEVGF